MSPLDELEKRLRIIEDERAVERLIASYGPLVDAGEADGAAALWATDGSYDVEGWHMRSRDDVAAMVRSDDAVAVCESVLLLRTDDRYIAARAGANHFRLRRVDGRWQIIERTTRALDGSSAPRKLLSAGVIGAAPDAS